MKKLILIFGLLVGSALLWQSCTKEDSILDDGDSKDSFVGTWNVNDQCSKQTYGVDIKSDEGNSTQVIIVNFANLGKSATAVIAGNNIYVENQEVGSGYSVSGNGKLTGSIISWSSYNYETEAELVECTAIFSK